MAVTQRAEPRADGAERIVAVVLTMCRPRELERLLGSLSAQDHRPAEIIVVENTPHPENAALLAHRPGVRHVVSRRNLGGAGGFAYGIYLALAAGATHVWLMDDDGRPETEWCLGDLLSACRRHDADLVSPVILDSSDPTRLAFPYFTRLRRFETRAALTRHGVVEGFAHLFNGALVRASAFERFGMPDFRLFLRGDEVDFLHRMRRGGGVILSLPEVGFLHPPGAPETHPILGGALNAVMPGDPAKQYYFFRNRGYLVRQHRLVLHLVSDLVRYPYHFLVTRRGDVAGLVRWIGLGAQGWRQVFHRHDTPGRR